MTTHDKPRFSFARVASATLLAAAASTPTLAFAQDLPPVPAPAPVAPTPNGDVPVAPAPDLPPAPADNTPPTVAPPTPPVATEPPTQAPVTTDLGIAPAAEPAPAPSGPNGMLPTDPLAGFSSDTVYLRSRDNEFVMMPSGRLQIDGYSYNPGNYKMPTPSLILRRARLEVAGWVGPWFFYNLAGDFALGAPAAADPVAQTWAQTTDDFIGIAPWKDLAVLQIGQYDAPFMLENRTSDKYIDFMERSITVRDLGIPSNKEVGAMVNGLLPKKMAYYSIGVFNGDGQNFRNVDNKFDGMGRAWIAPFAMAGVKALEDAEIGGSFWVGSRGDNGLKLATQTTQAGFTFLDPTWKITPATGAATPVEVHQHGSFTALAAELNLPIDHKFGLRSEYVHRRQDLSADDATSATALKSLSGGQLKGWSIYTEAWVWLVGDDTILPQPGLELQPRLKKYENKAPRPGVQVLARFEHLDETVTMDKEAVLGTDTLSGNRRINSFELGANYWHSKRFRGTLNYVLNHFDGNAKGLVASEQKLGPTRKTEHEFLFRIAVAL